MQRALILSALALLSALATDTHAAAAQEAALAGATSRVGLIATCSTTYTEPFNLARQFASIDHISNGRVGWNIVTTWLAAASGNYGGQGPLSHAERYERAELWPRVAISPKKSAD